MEDRAGKRSVTDNFERQNKPKIQKFNDRRKKSFKFTINDGNIGHNWSCPWQNICNFQPDTKERLKNHFKMFPHQLKKILYRNDCEVSTKKYRCIICRKTFKSSRKYKKHAISHDNFDLYQFSIQHNVEKQFNLKANEFKMQAWLNANEGIDEIPTDDEDDFSQDENDSANESMDDEHDQAAVELDELVVENVENVEVVVDAADVAGPVEPDFENFDDEKFDD